MPATSVIFRCLLSSLMASVAIGCAQPTTTAIEAFEVDFGTVAAGGRALHCLALPNSLSSQPISHWQSSCDCLNVYSRAGTGEIDRILFLALVADFASSPDFSGNLRVRIDGTDNSHQIVCTGWARISVRNDPLFSSLVEQVNTAGSTAPPP